jgi:hypothetical protein
MARPVWCRYEDCRARRLVIGGVLLNICPECTRSAMWTFEPGNWIKPKQPIDAGPRVPYILNINDRKLLRRLRITADD